MLTASDPAAKIWYVLDANATPNDMLPYISPIRIETSTPLLFFAYTDTKNESKIERRDYTISLPTTLQFSQSVAEIPSDASSVSVTIENSGDRDIPVSGWILRTDIETQSLNGIEAIGAKKQATFSIPY